MNWSWSHGTYHLHPEAKLTKGEHTDAGATERRHVHPKGVEHIGKEANRWEEFFFVGDDPKAQVSYAEPIEHRVRRHRELAEAIRQRGVRRVARETGLSVGLVSGIASGKRRPTKRSQRRLLRVQ